MIIAVESMPRKPAPETEDADEPVITTVNANSNAIAWFILKPLAPTVREMHAFIMQHPRLTDGGGNNANAADVVRPLLHGLAEHDQVDLTKLNKLAQTYPAAASVLQIFCSRLAALSPPCQPPPWMTTK